MPVPGVPSGVLPLSAEAPGYLALDTSAVFHALLESESRHEAYRDYLRGALERGSRLMFSVFGKAKERLNVPRGNGAGVLRGLNSGVHSTSRADDVELIEPLDDAMTVGVVQLLLLADPAPSTAPRLRSCSCHALSARAPRGRTTVVERCRDHIGQAIRVASPGWRGAPPGVPDGTRGQSRRASRETAS
jgi:hypothetical protein